MLFRYKVKPNKPSTFSNPTPYNYRAKIQMYNENAHIFHWKTIEDATLRYMACELEPSYDGIVAKSGAERLSTVLMRYENMGNFVKAYIVDILGESWKRRNQANQYEDQIFKFAVTDGWNCIEIKEDNN